MDAPIIKQKYVAKYGTIVEEATTGLHMPEPIAKAIAEEMPKDLPAGIGYRRHAHKVKKFEVEPGTRTDISYINTDEKDREDEVVLPSGMDKSGYAGVVTLCHDYKQPFGASCMWAKHDDGKIVAATKYHTKPQDWGDSPWMPSAVLHLQQQDPPACTGKSIGLMPQHVRRATSVELKSHPDWDGAPIVDKWRLLEYAVTPLGMNPSCLTLAVSKGILDIEGMELLGSFPGVLVADVEVIMPPPFIAPETLQKAIAEKRALQRLTWAKRLREQVVDEIHRLRGTA